MVNIKQTLHIIKQAQHLVRLAARIDTYMNMFKNFPNQDKIKQEIEWAIKHLKKHDRVIWYLKQYRQSLETNIPISFKDQLMHFMGMMTALPKMQSYVFDANKTPTEIFKELEELEKQAQEARSKQGYAGKKIPMQEGIDKFIDLGGGWAWWNLNKSYCEEEGNALAHCGNVEGDERTTDNLLSLRKDVKVDNQIHHEPYLTFIINKGYLGEMKAIANKKPPESLHPQIIALLKDPRIKGVVGGGYEDDKNFNINDLTETQRQEVFKANPSLLPENQNVFDYPDHHKAAVAENPNTPLDILLELTKDENKKVRRGVAKNLNTPLEILMQLAKDKDEFVRRGVAGNPNAPLEILIEFAKDRNEWTRIAVAENFNTSPEILMQLAKDGNERVRRAVAENLNTPPEILIQLAKDKDEFVRRGVVHNPNTPLEILMQLAEEGGDIKELATQNIQQRKEKKVAVRKTLHIIKQAQQKLQILKYSMNPQIKLFLDDDVTASVRQELFRGYDVWVTTPEEAIEYLSKGNISHISLDHDLGLSPESRNGYMVAKWIEEAAFNKQIPPLSWRVHSFNPKGKSNMIAALQSADRFWSNNE